MHYMQMGKWKGSGKVQKLEVNTNLEIFNDLI